MKIWIEKERVEGFHAYFKINQFLTNPWLRNSIQREQICIPQKCDFVLDYWWCTLLLQYMKNNKGIIIINASSHSVTPRWSIIILFCSWLFGLLRDDAHLLFIFQFLWKFFCNSLRIWICKTWKHIYTTFSPFTKTHKLKGVAVHVWLRLPLLL